MELNEKIRYLRNKLNLTLEDVGNAVGVGKSTVLKWENGDIANMRRDKILELARILQTTPAYLMGWDENESTKENIPDRILRNIPILHILEKYCEQFNKNFDSIIKYYQDPINEASLISLISCRGLKGNDNMGLEKVLGCTVSDAVKIIEPNPERYLPLVLTRAEINMILALRNSMLEDVKESSTFPEKNQKAI